MRTILKRLSAVIPAAVLTACALSLHSAAEGSVEDVYEAMRRIGMPETMIQDAKTQYQNTPHDENGMEINGNYYEYDIWADYVELYEDDIWKEVGKQFNVSGSEIKAKMKTTAPDPQENGGSSETHTTAVSYPEPEKPFINMTLQEKQDYVASLPEDQRAGFLASLTTSERNSIIKQMDTDSQANVMSGFIGLGEQLGMHISVDQIGGEGLNYSVRNSEGELIDSNSVSAVADDTGWDMTVPVLGGSLMTLAAFGGLVWLCIRGRKQEAVNG